MTKEELIKEQANYYLDNDVTMQQVANHFGFKSKKTIQINMKKLESVDPELFKLVEEKKQGNLVTGMVKGGQNGKPTMINEEGNAIIRKPKSITDQEIKDIAELIIFYKWTLREAEENLGISKSTLYDNLTRERLGDDLYNRYTSTLEFNKMNTNKSLASVDIDTDTRGKK